MSATMEEKLDDELLAREVGHLETEAGLRAILPASYVRAKFAPEARAVLYPGPDVHGYRVTASLKTRVTGYPGNVQSQACRAERDLGRLLVGRVRSWNVSCTQRDHGEQDDDEADRDPGVRGR